CSKNGGRVRIPNNRHISHPLRSEIVQEILTLSPCARTKVRRISYKVVVVHTHCQSLKNRPFIIKTGNHHPLQVSIGAQYSNDPTFSGTSSGELRGYELYGNGIMVRFIVHVIDVNVKDMEIDLSNLGTLNSIIAIIIRISGKGTSF
ncbi:hypothetical protein M8C21_020646, partial [Ambrosia artemisiifolia]